MKEALVSIAAGAGVFLLLRGLNAFDGIPAWVLFAGAALCLTPVIWSELRRTGRR